jgi:hypothetical protein
MVQKDAVVESMTILWNFLSALQSKEFNHKKKKVQVVKRTQEGQICSVNADTQLT